MSCASTRATAAISEELANKKTKRVLATVALAGCASIIGLLFYLAPIQNATFLNRIADYVSLNDAVAFANDRGIFAKLHLPAVDFEAPNDRLVLIKIDEESIGNTAAGLTAFPFPRSDYGRLLSNLQ